MCFSPCSPGSLLLSKFCTGNSLSPELWLAGGHQYLLAACFQELLQHARRGSQMASATPMLAVPELGGAHCSLGLAHHGAKARAEQGAWEGCQDNATKCSVGSARPVPAASRCLKRGWDLLQAELPGWRLSEEQVGDEPGGKSPSLLHARANHPDAMQQRQQQGRWTQGCPVKKPPGLPQSCWPWGWHQPREYLPAATPSGSHFPGLTLQPHMAQDFIFNQNQSCKVRPRWQLPRGLGKLPFVLQKSIPGITLQEAGSVLQGLPRTFTGITMNNSLSTEFHST